ncbi:SDR family oxidoreductase [Terriglobus albidus]|uniref:SDR family oxidoreductase n=1 Tax=Terriglobus albidus TaxID=1592106 RepID=A0A5B9EAY7_9BACT|nr:SDR family NAD(P)-dependent oxidoreductase [Terriglobus albidus]QEE28919.1 SDR family oxidoreductase [Terriglobus albidus]
MSTVANTTYQSSQTKTALITGGGSGIGEAICRKLGQEGLRVIVADLDMAAATRVASELPNARPLHIDVGSEESVAAATAGIDGLDILVNNAGVGMVGSIAETETAEFERVMRVNVNSVFYVTRSFLPKLLAARGSIINIASVAGLVGIKRRFAYCASKGAVVAMTRQLAVEYPRELRVNCICPGTIDSPFVAGYLAKYHAGEEEKVRAELNDRQPVGRLGHPSEVAALVRYLCSPEADFMHGAALALDGGWTAA